MTIAEDFRIRRFISTPHLEGSCLQVGDDSKARLPFSALTKGTVTYAEKADAGNSGFCFDGAGAIYGQSRGHFLDLHDRSIWRERHFNLFKDWLLCHADAFLERFEDRYIVYGEWMGASQTIFYDRLPHLFLEFDIFDRLTDSWLDTPARRALTKGLPIVSVPVLYRGPAVSLEHLQSFVLPSVLKTPSSALSGGWKAGYDKACGLVDADPAHRSASMLDDDVSEGLYIKVEDEGRVILRCKWVRSGFKQIQTEANDHWHSQIHVPNLLGTPTDIFPSYLSSGSAEANTYDPDAPEKWAPWLVNRP